MKDTGSRFMRDTRSANISEPPQKQGLPQPPLEKPYPLDAALLDLPEPEALQMPALDLRAAIEQRASRRQYTPQAYTLEELAYLLWLTQGG